MFVRPTPLDIRVDHVLVGHATDEVEAALLNERLDALSDWMVGEDETKWSLLWKRWLEIARPEQLPPQFDPNWREWKIDGHRGSGRTRAAAEFIVSQLGDEKLRVYAIAASITMAEFMANYIHKHSDSDIVKKSSSFEVAGVPIIHRAVEQIEDNLGVSNGQQTIVWLDGLIFTPRGINVGKFHSFIHRILRAPRTRVIWSG